MTKCETCGKEFATVAALAQHQKDKHGTTTVSPSKETRQGGRGGRQRPRSLRKRNRHPVALGLLAIAIALGLLVYIVAAPSFAPPPVYCTTAGTGTYIHVHPYLNITIGGQKVTIPAFIGFLTARGCTEEIHTHDTSGIIHIELDANDKNSNYTLNDFFRVWNATYATVSFNGTAHPVVFTNTDILGYKNDATHRVLVLIDGNPVSNGVKIPLEQLDYCDSTNANVAPCSPTAGGNPLWNGGSTYPYGTLHTIVIEYVAT